MYCPNCGTEKRNSSVKFCSNCGFQFYSTPQHTRNNDEKWLITMLLCFFLGSFGIHRFYTNNTGTGVAMLITLGGCGIWTLIDFIMILLNEYKDGDGNRLK